MKKALKFVLSTLCGTIVFAIITGIMLIVSLSGMVLVVSPVAMVSKVTGWAMYIVGTASMVTYLCHARSYWTEQFRAFFPRRPEVVTFI